MPLTLIQNIGKKQSRTVKPEDMPRVRSLIDEITKMCFEPIGFFQDGALAISHCQVDQDDPLRFFVLNDGSCVVNPQIVEYIGVPFRNEEGCMSKVDVSTLFGVQRHKQVRVNFIGIADKDAPEDKVTNMRIKGMLALIFQHEVDHMNGKHIFN